VVLWAAEAWWLGLAGALGAFPRVNPLAARSWQALAPFGTNCRAGGRAAADRWSPPGGLSSPEGYWSLCGLR
jgi:hypothetical protein